MGDYRVELMRAFEPEDPIECDGCGSLLDLRFWQVEYERILCPRCLTRHQIVEILRRQAGV